MKETQILRVRDCTKQENDKLSVLSGKNENMISFRETYLLDQDNYLMDSEGVYLTE